MSRQASVREVSLDSWNTEITYSICTLVTRPVEYQEMLESFNCHGFDKADCEYLYIDNSRTNQAEAFAAYNLFLSLAKGRYVILCHQDIVLLQDDRKVLDARLTELEGHDPTWGVCGNAGAMEDGRLVLRITDPHTPDAAIGGPFPSRVMGVDENFIIARRRGNLALSRDLAGFHLYGADLCIMADVLGFHSYVIDFHLHHKSSGNIDVHFAELSQNLVNKYRRAFRTRTQHATTQRPLILTGSTTRAVFLRLWRFGRRVQSLATRARRKSKRILWKIGN